MSRLTIDVTDEQHKNLKAVAALQGKTIRQFAIERLFPADSDEDQVWEELKTLLTQRLEEVNAGKVSSRSILDIANEGLRRHKAA